MIVQTASPGEPHFVIEQTDHARACGQLAQAFGRAPFALPEPAEWLVAVVTHHDEGWAAVDAAAQASASTGLPHHLTQTPLPYLIRTSQGSPAFNERQHPFGGLLSSMHSYGLFNGRYGLSDFLFIEKIAAEHKDAAQAMLADEVARQTRLKNTLLADPATAAWVQADNLFTHYKLLQFFDTLGLYFHMTHPSARREARFVHVPDAHGVDHTLTLTPQADGTCTLTPFPFAGQALTFTTLGRYVQPQPAEADWPALLAATPKTAQTYHLVAG